MSGAPSVVCVVPARGGSKAVPRKNLRMLAGVPLLEHTLRHAREAACIGGTVVSTDDREIAALARRCGAAVVERPADLSGDEATSESAIAHALDELEREGRAPDVIVFLQCTSPFRRRGDIDSAARPVLDGAADSVVSVVPFHGFLWERDAAGAGKALNYDPARRPRRQDMAPRYKENGSIYVFTRELFRRTGVRLGGRVRLHVMEEAAALDIDTEVDLRIAEALYAVLPAEWRGR